MTWGFFVKSQNGTVMCMERLPQSKEPSQVEQNQKAEQARTKPSYGFLSFFARQCLPYEGYSLSIAQRAEDLDESPEKIIDAIEIIHKMKALEYIRDGDNVTVIHKKPNNVTPGAYYKVFPLDGPVNSVDTRAPLDPLFDESF